MTISGYVPAIGEKDVEKINRSIRNLYESTNSELTAINSVLTAARTGFSAHKNATDQTGITAATNTQVTFGTEVYDTGGYFASSAWTPPSGLVSLSAQISTSGTWAESQYTWILIYKNGAAYKSTFPRVYAANSGIAQISITDRANGTDAYTVWVYQPTSSGTVTVQGTISYTYFMGAWLGP